jgi:predicted glycoside hydrolase/deacetylase ChbG (UPF0249 family)
VKILVKPSIVSRAFAAWIGLAPALCSAQSSNGDRTFGERLGWKPNEVVVVLHVDDVGMSHASNLGAIEAAEKGVATSWSVMMPCSWVPEIARYLKKHPHTDSGLHVTLTSEWALYRWGPLAGRPQVPGLVDSEGCLWHSLQQVVTNATPDEIEREIRAQIERAERLGIPITHLDSHMGAVFARPDYFERFARVGIEKGIPILAVGGHATHLSRQEREAGEKLAAWPKQVWNAGLPVLDDLFTGFTRSRNEEKPEKLLTLLRELKPGLTEIIFHASQPTDELSVITRSSGARQADLKVLTDPRVKKLIQERGIIRTTWKELKERRKKAAPME